MPVAFAAGVSVAVIFVLLTTMTLLATTLAPVTLSVDCPVTKFVPVNVTLVPLPCGPREGLNKVSVGGVPAASTVKDTALLVPLPVVTETFCAPRGALAAMVNVAVTWLAVATTLLMAIPFSELMVAPVRFDPLSVTGVTTLPACPEVGLMLFSTGDCVAAFTVSVKLCTAFDPTPLAAVKEML